MSIIYSWVKDIIIFLLLTTIISNLLGKSNYKKYINLITGIILVLIVISPLLRLFQLDNILDYFFNFNTLSTEAKNIDDKLINMEQGQMDEILKEYKKEIKKQVRELLEDKNVYLKSIKMEIEEDKESDKFGKLKSMDITASYVRQDTNESSSKINPITIDDIEIGGKTKSETKEEENSLSPDEINIKNLLSDFYNVNPDNINISIQEQ